MREISNYELILSASMKIQEYCDNHECCDNCNIAMICNILPLSLSETLERIAKNKEK